MNSHPVQSQNRYSQGVKEWRKRGRLLRGWLPAHTVSEWQIKDSESGEQPGGGLNMDPGVSRMERVILGAGDEVPAPRSCLLGPGVAHGEPHMLFTESSSGPQFQGCSAPATRPWIPPVSLRAAPGYREHQPAPNPQFY